jgi:uncharacterized DUF497 family protein
MIAVAGSDDRSRSSYEREGFFAISYTYEVEDAIRVISMRKATPYERKKFLERFLH